MRKPQRIAGAFFLLSISSIAVWVKLKCQLDLLLFQVFKQYWGLACDFWAENEERYFSVVISVME
jgi:hypothetical protein